MLEIETVFGRPYKIYIYIYIYIVFHVYLLKTTREEEHTVRFNRNQINLKKKTFIKTPNIQLMNLSNIESSILMMSVLKHIF